MSAGEGAAGADAASQGAQEQNELWLWIAAVNFDAAIFDTDDLATIRGGSWALLEIPDAFEKALPDALGVLPENVKTVFTGSSEGLFRIFDSGLTPEALEDEARDLLKTLPGHDKDKGEQALLARIAQYAPFAVAAIKPGEQEDEAAMRRLRRRLAVARFRHLDVDIPAEQAGDMAPYPCEKDRTRPRSAYEWRRDEDGRARRDVPVSCFVAARRTFGRTGRRFEFYRQHAGWPHEDEFGLADDFEELVQEVDEAPEEVPENWCTKMAVLYFDVNRLGRIKAKMGALSRLGALQDFSRQVKDRRRNLLRHLLEVFRENKWLQYEPSKEKLPPGDDANLLVCPDQKQEDGGAKNWPLRKMPVHNLETLLWGADESLMVFPAWGVQDVLERLAELMQQEESVLVKVAGQKTRLSLGIGLVICHYKTPIRLVKNLAWELAEAAKASIPADADWRRLPNRLQYMVLGGIDLPARPLAEEREALYGLEKKLQPQAFTLELECIPGTFTLLERIRGEGGAGRSGVPRGKLVALMQEALREGGLTWQKGAEKLDDIFDAAIAKKEFEGTREDWGSEELAYTEDVPLAPLAHMLALWPLAGLRTRLRAAAQEGREAAA